MGKRCFNDLNVPEEQSERPTQAQVEARIVNALLSVVIATMDENERDIDGV